MSTGTNAKFKKEAAELKTDLKVSFDNLMNSIEFQEGNGFPISDIEFMICEHLTSLEKLQNWCDE